ncbi:MAG TPA: hypothetical protein VNZ45_02645 [Bacteroidia bacterium]|jgi:hypothetical protein|nr:hypothetical protein [Bacteroidia bacterium]
MELTNKICFSVEKESRTYEFHLPAGAPYGEAYDAAFQFLAKVSEMAKEAAEAQKPQDKQEEVAAELV